MTAASAEEDGVNHDTSSNSVVKEDCLINYVQSCGLFYGFIVLITATVGKIFTSPGQSPCIGVAITPIRESLGITRSDVTLLYLVATTCSAITLPWTTGRAIDKLGPQKCVVAIALGLAAACFIVSTAYSRLHLLFAFFLLRFFGQGSLMNVSLTEINYWWVKRRGVMMGFAGACVSLGMLALVPAFMNHSIESVGWRKTYVLMGKACALFMAPWGFIWYRDRPETYGLQPDGEQPPAEGMSDKEDEDENITDDTNALQTTEDWTTGEALRTGAFWVFACARLSSALTGTAFWFHLKEVLSDAGLSENVQTSMYPFLAFSAVVGRFVSGYIADRVEARWILLGALCMSSVSLFLVPWMGYHSASHPGGGGNALVFVVGILQTISSSFGATAGSVVYANNFGRKHLGTIQTFASSCGVLGSALGPFPWGVVRDMTGSYTLAFRLGAILPLVCACGVFLKGRRPVKGPQLSGEHSGKGYLVVDTEEN